MDFDFNKIASGPKFNELVSALLRQEDHNALIFNRDGKDGAIDALSGDRKTVFQSKYHHAGSSTLAFADAKKELAKIEEYRTPGHKWHALWKAVENWCLVTNVPFGTQDELRWQREVVPEFKKHGLAATYKTAAHLKTELIRHRDIADAFFGDRTRLFISLPEHREALVAREVLERAYDLPFEGRESELARIRAFVESSPHHVLVIEGEGGVGKSRLQYEAAVAIADAGMVETVYCGTPHLAGTQEWYMGIVPESKALVVIDDPTDAEFVKRFLAELRTRTRSWKAIITVRSHRDPVIASLHDPREQLVAPPIVLSPLPEAPAGRFAAELLRPLTFSDAERPRVERWLAEVCGRFPIWMTVAAKLLESRDDLRELPKDGYGIAVEYVADIVRHTPPEVATPAQALEMLRWVALAQPVNRLDAGTLELLAEATGLASAQAERLLSDLSRRRAVTFFGVSKRMVEVRPDVLRDHVLLEWLTYRDGATQHTSQAARELADALSKGVLEGHPSPIVQPIVQSLARLEHTIEPRPPFLDPLADAAVTLAGNAVDTVAQRRAISVAELIAPYRPAKLARVSELIRTRTVPVGRVRTLFQEIELSRARVLGELPWQLFLAARAAMSKAERAAIVRELAMLVDLEAALEGRRGNTGRTAMDLLPRILHEQHSYRSSFDAEAAAFANDALNRVAAGEQPRESWKVVVRAITALDRHDAYVSRDDRNAFTFERFQIGHEGKPGKIAASIRDRLWEIAAKPGPFSEAKRFAWPLIEAMHGDLPRAKAVPGWRAMLIDNLKRCLIVASNPSTQLEDLQAARSLWDWHVQHDNDAEVRPIADACEEAYLKYGIVAKYAPVFADRRDADRVLKAAAQAWPSTASAEELEEYVAGAFLFARTDADAWRENRVFSFLAYLGRFHGDDAGVRDFIAKQLAKGSTSDLFPAALRVANAALFAQRERKDETALRATLDWLDGAVGDEASRVHLLGSIYPGTGKVVARTWMEADRAFMDKHWQLMETLPVQSRFFVMGRRLHAEPAMQPRVVAAVEPLQAAERTEAINALWSGYEDLLPYPFTRADLSLPAVELLLDLMALEPELGDGDGDAHWQIEQVLKTIPPKPAAWIVDVVRRRLKAFGAHNKQVHAEKSGAWVFILPGDDALILSAVEPIPDEEPTAESQAAVAQLFEMAALDATVERYLGQFLAKLDPHGRVGPVVLAKMIADELAVPDAEAIREWSHHAGWYRSNSLPWRVIARAACARVLAESTEEERRTVFSSLRSWRAHSWTGTPGELHPRFQDAIDAAKKAEDEETEPALKPYWAWTRMLAELDLEDAKGKLEERDDY